MPEPWIWLQDTEDYGRADCGCELFQSYGGSGAGVLLCPLHEAAPALLAALEGVLNWYRQGEVNAQSLHVWAVFDSTAVEAAIAKAKE